MSVLILGGDGYLGWPTAMHLSIHGHDVTVVDNFLRRNIMQNEDVEPLHNVPSLYEHIRRWKNATGCDIELL